jgi:allantoate deiminase
MNQIQSLLDNLTRKVGANYNIDVKLRTHPVNLSKKLIDSLEESCQNNHYTYKVMTSGAAHDAMIFAEKIDTALIFVPSLNGRSHCPEEWTDIQYLSKSVKTVYEIIEKMNQRDA